MNISLSKKRIFEYNVGKIRNNLRSLEEIEIDIHLWAKTAEIWLHQRYKDLLNTFRLEHLKRLESLAIIDGYANIYIVYPPAIILYDAFHYNGNIEQLIVPGFAFAIGIITKISLGAAEARLAANFDYILLENFILAQQVEKLRKTDSPQTINY